MSDVSGLTETADKQLEKRTALRKELEDYRDKETNLIQKQAPMESELSSKKKALQDTKQSLTELEDFKTNYKVVHLWHK